MRTALLLALLAFPAFAQSAKDKVERAYKPMPVQHLTFTGEDIDGTRDAPTIENIYAVPRPGFDTLIRVRTNFSDKLLESVHEL